MHSQPHDTEIACLPQIPSGVRVHRLDNGLELIIREDASAPVVSVQAWARAGSIDEGPWLGAGLSHVLEHMLFKGTSTRGSGRIDQEVQSAGGYMNAYTSFDRTVYWINVPDSGATTAIDILCDIFQNATLPADELEKELDVIRREMDMGEDDPGRRSSKGLFRPLTPRAPTAIRSSDCWTSSIASPETTCWRITAPNTHRTIASWWWWAMCRPTPSSNRCARPMPGLRLERCR